MTIEYPQRADPLFRFIPQSGHEAHHYELCLPSVVFLFSVFAFICADLFDKDLHSYFFSIRVEANPHVRVQRLPLKPVVLTDVHPGSAWYFFETSSCLLSLRARLVLQDFLACLVIIIIIITITLVMLFVVYHPCLTKGTWLILLTEVPEGEDGDRECCDGCGTND